MEGMEISVGWETIFLFTKMDVMLGWLKKLPIQTSKKTVRFIRKPSVGLLKKITNLAIFCIKYKSD